MPPLKAKGHAPDLTTDLLGHVFEERYQIERQLGQGGIGVVYYACDTKLGGRPVAVKVLSEMMGMRQSQRRRFEREAKALAALSHPNVVSVIDYGVADHTPYLVMELLEGQSLSQLLADDAPLDWERARHLMNQMLAGLSYVHDRNIAHRDLKPGNLFVQSLPGMGERVKLLDFGLAKFLDPSDDGATLTRSGEIFGTPGYMPPEQLLGKAVDTRADVYSTCVLLYEMLAGRKPFVGANLAEVLKRQLAGDVPRLVDAETGRVAHPALDALLARGMAVDAEARFRDAHELASALAALPARCIEVQSEEQREKVRKEKHDAATRAERLSDVATVANAPAGAPAPANRTQAAPQKTRGLVARAASALVALCSSVLRAGAVMLSLVSVLVIVGAGIVIYVSSRPELAQTREALRKVLPTGATASQEDVAVKAAHEAGDEPREQSGRQAGASVQKTLQVAARDPWRSSVPPALRSARALMLKNRAAGEKTLSHLRRYNTEHPDDARGHLLLGGLYVNRGWFSDGVQQYEHAFRTDPSARGDTHALRDLLSLASQPDDVWARAQRLLAETYGTELRDDLDQAVRRTNLPAARTRLLALAAEVGTLPAQRKEP